MLSVSHVGMQFGGLQALAGVSLEVGAGERRAIIGPNGAGKTTLFNVLGGQLRPTVGRVRLFDRDITAAAPHTRAQMGLARTFQISKLFGRLTVLDNLVLAIQGVDRCRFSLWRSPLSRRHITARAAGLLHQWNLWDLRHTPVRNLSYGDQRQLEIVLALASNPKVLLLDEPTAGLSPAETGMVISMLGRLDRDITIVLIEHDIDFVFNLADRIAVLHLGKLLADGTAAEVRRDPRIRDIYLGAD